MSEKSREMLPIPPELLAESTKSIGLVMDTGMTIDLNQQGDQLKKIQNIYV